MCSIISAKLNNDILVGRNFDWLQCGAKIHVLPSERKYGLMTNKHIIIEQLGEDRPFEGINEYGLFIGMTSFESQFQDNKNKLDFCALGIMKFILERAKNSIEALKIFQNVNLNYNHDENYTYTNYLFCDQSGNTILFDENMEPIKKKLKNNEWIYLHAGLPIDSFQTQKDQWCVNLINYFKNKKKPDITEACKIAKTHDTAWTTNYNLTSLSFILFIEQNYDIPFSFSFNDLISKGKYTKDFGNLKLSRLKEKKDLKSYKHQIYHESQKSGFPGINEE